MGEPSVNYIPNRAVVELRTPPTTHILETWHLGARENKELRQRIQKELESNQDTDIYIRLGSIVIEFMQEKFGGFESAEKIKGHIKANPKEISGLKYLVESR